MAGHGYTALVKVLIEQPSVTVEHIRAGGHSAADGVSERASRDPRTIDGCARPRVGRREGTRQRCPQVVFGERPRQGHAAASWTRTTTGRSSAGIGRHDRQLRSAAVRVSAQRRRCWPH
eukprot:2333749-Prymnesium_polylepis.1